MAGSSGLLLATGACTAGGLAALLVFSYIICKLIVQHTYSSIYTGRLEKLESCHIMTTGLESLKACKLYLSSWGKVGSLNM